jgi:uncharacterized protein DUF4760
MVAAKRVASPVGCMQVYYNPPPATVGVTRTTASTAEVVSSTFAVLGGLAVILTLYFNIWQSIETNDRQTVENTFALLRSWDDSALLVARRFTRELGDRQSQLAPDQLVKEINSNTDLRQSVVLVLNFVEHVAYSMRTGRVDVAAVRRALGSILINIHQRLLPWINDMNTRSPGYSKDLEDHIDLLRPPRGAH